MNIRINRRIHPDLAIYNRKQMRYTHLAQWHKQGNVNPINSPINCPLFIRQNEGQTLINQGFSRRERFTNGEFIAIVAGKIALPRSA